MSDWIDFERDLSSKQKLPEEHKNVLVQVETRQLGVPHAILVGYLRYAAGDKDSPQFIVPGLPRVDNADGMPIVGRIMRWCDCLDGFIVPSGYND